MKRILCMVLLSALALSAGCQKPDQAKGIAVVDMGRVQAHSQVLAKADAYLNNIKQDLVAKAMEAEKAYQADSTPEKDTLRKAAVTKLQTVLGSEQQRLAATLKAKMDAVLENYRAAHGYSVILLRDTVMASDPSMDVTDDITQGFDQVELDLTLPPASTEKPAATTEQPAAEEPAATAPAEKTATAAPEEQPAAETAAPGEQPEAPAN